MTMQAAMLKNMVESLLVPTFRVGYLVITNALDELYEKVKSKGVTITVLLAKTAAMALAQHPVVNASCKDGKSFSYNSNINIAEAVAIDGGLVTPVLQDADKLDIYLRSQKWKKPSSMKSFDGNILWNCISTSGVCQELRVASQLHGFTFNELRCATRNFRNDSLFGEGGFDCLQGMGQGECYCLYETLFRIYCYCQDP